MTRRFLLAAALALCASAHAQDYPARPIRIVVPYPAGGSADLLPRIFAEKLGAKWGQAVLVENGPGAARRQPEPFPQAGIRPVAVRAGERDGRDPQRPSRQSRGAGKSGG